MDANKMSAMLQANKVWTIIAMMGYQTKISISGDDCTFLKEVEVVAFYETGDINAKDIIERTIRKNMIDGDSYESKKRNDTAWTTYTTKWK